MNLQTPTEWDDDAELEFEREVNRAWLEWREQFSIAAVLEVKIGLRADATVVRRKRLRGTGGLPGHPRAVSRWSDQLIDDARADLIVRLEQDGLNLTARGVQKIAVGYVIEFLKSRDIAVNEEKEFRTILRRIVQGENYKHPS